MPEKLKDKGTKFIFPENGNFGDLSMQTGKVLFFSFGLWYRKLDPDYFGD